MSDAGSAPDEANTGTYRVFQDNNPNASPTTEVAWYLVVAGTGDVMVEHWVLSDVYAWMNPASTGLCSRIRVNPTQYANLTEFMTAKWVTGYTYIVQTCVPTTWPPA